MIKSVGGIIMKTEESTFTDEDNVDIFYYKWSPEDSATTKGVVQISHGMAELSARYIRLASALTSSGYIVYANDHRGHGRTALSLDSIGYPGDRDGFSWMVMDMHQLSHIIKAENPGVPLFLLGHSMGSFLSQRYIQLYGDEIEGLVLSGTNGKQGFALDLGILVARLEIKLRGRRAKSPTLNSLSFGSFNKRFHPSRTEFDWLSRDPAEVDKYIRNEYCGGIFTAGFFHDFFEGLKEIENPSNMAYIPQCLPVYIFSGEKDPVGGFTKGVMRLVEAYRSLGMKDVTYRFYKDGRHEMLNEVNRDQVIADLIAWLNSK
jgi:alpha-beta hydrolase superfamily lysophospholipase